jgi:hypothetical protein
MGLFDTYGDRQMKMGEPYQWQYDVGDSVKASHVDDGVYIDEEDNKAIVIHNGIFIGEFNCYDYWGNPLAPQKEAEKYHWYKDTKTAEQARLNAERIASDISIEARKNLKKYSDKAIKEAEL